LAMGIFSKWASTIPVSTVRLDELGQNPTSKALRDVRDNSGLLEQFLKARKLMPSEDAYAEEIARERVEESGVVPIMMETCAAINELVGRTIVDAHTFLPPDPLRCCFIYVEDGAEYFMRLELRGETPTLVFSERQWRDTVTNDFVRWARRLVEIEPVTINVKLVREIKDAPITAEQVREWFFYLISGLNSSHTPSSQ
jgi:hypothetical protein